MATQTSVHISTLQGEAGHRAKGRRKVAKKAEAPTESFVDVDANGTERAGGCPDLDAIPDFLREAVPGVEVGAARAGTDKRGRVS